MRYMNKSIRKGIKITNWYVIGISNLFNIYTRNLSVYSRGENWGRGEENNDKKKNRREYTYAHNTLQRIIYNCLQTRLFYLLYTFYNGARLSINTSVQIYTCVEDLLAKKKQKKKKNK